MRWCCRGLPLVPVLCPWLPSVAPAAPVAVVWCRLAAVSACCPVLPEAVVGASRATRGRLASTQGCQRCPCPSPWVATGIARVVAVAAPARSASTQRQHPPRQRKQRSSATLSKKRKHRRSLRKHVAAVAVRLPVLPLLSAVRLLLRSCGVSLLPLSCGPPGAAVVVRLPDAAALCRSALPAPLLLPRCARSRCCRW
jgi:hypothetical protein